MRRTWFIIYVSKPSSLSCIASPNAQANDCLPNRILIYCSSALHGDADVHTVLVFTEGWWGQKLSLRSHRGGGRATEARAGRHDRHRPAGEPCRLVESTAGGNPGLHPDDARYSSRATAGVGSCRV